ncbi:MAG: response regulator [Candidatus Latescibacterota bacterium]
MPTILVVEDESIVAMDIQVRLQRMGYRVPAVLATAAEAVTQADALRPDLVLMDIRLRGSMDGIQAARILQGEHHVPVVLLTAYSDQGTLERAKAATPYGYVLKPFKDQELHTTIEVALCKHDNELRLRQAYANLEARVQERTEELARVNEELRHEIDEHRRTDEERARLEDQLRHSQKMEALGRLAAGVAHDFNNMLTIIGGYCELIMARMGDDDLRYRDMRTIQEAVERATALTGRLLAFGRRQLLDLQTVDINARIAKTFDMLRRLIGEDIALTTGLEPGLLLSRTDPGQFDQVVINLVINARDAMPQGGRLLIETATVELGPDYPRCRVDVQSGAYVRVRVRDTGCGMTPEVLSRAFEPFFTTKGNGRGTGLGLAVAYGIVQQSGGHIDVESQPGQGTTFDVFLPVADVRADAGGLGTAGDQPPAARTRTILLVEDEELVRNLARRVLSEQGHRVLEASNGTEALEVARRHDGTIDLLLTDVVMPGLNGRQLAERLVLERPGTRVLYMSGYTDDTILRYGLQEGCVTFLQKPFAPAALTERIRQVLTQEESN